MAAIAEIQDSNEPPSPAGDGFIDEVVDYQGRPATRSQTGHWRSAYFIIGAGVPERFAYFGISSNLITYLTGHLRQPTATAAANVNMWLGVGAMMPLLGAFMADSFLGRYRTIVAASLLYILALGLLTISSMIDCQRSITLPLCSPSHLEVILFFVSLYLIAAAQGAHKPCIVAFGADQFDEGDLKEGRSKSTFFNWWYFGICAGPLVALLFLNYIQDNFSWVLGFGIPCISLILSLFAFLLGTKTYRYRMKDKENFAPSRIGLFFAKDVDTQIPSATIDGLQGAMHSSDNQIEFLNESLLEPADPEKHKDRCDLCDVEEFRAVGGLVPVWATFLAYAIAHAQTSTLFVEQAVTMERSIGSRFKIPAASFQYLTGLSIVIFVPIYDRIVVPIARTITGKPSGITKLQRVGTGLVLCISSMLTAALVERKRLETARLHGLIKMPRSTIPISYRWLVPQYVVFGVADVFTVVGLQELFYDQMPSELKSIGLSLNLSIFGIGSFLSSFLISTIENFTSKHKGGGWFCSNLNEANLDYFYWLLAGLNLLELLAFLYYAKSYEYR